MMQSVVNRDAQLFQNLDDYILVQQPNDEEMDGDDDSYDYCEDVYSLCSVDHDETFNVSSESLESRQTEEMELTVPPVLMRDLDEAHEAAKIVQIRDVEDPSDMSAISNQQETVTVEDGKIDSRDEEDVHIDNEADDNVSIDDNVDPARGYLKNEVPSLSRASNKKRRKKLKLMKKALAAANAAQALAECAKTGTIISNESSSSTKRSRRMKKKAGSIRASKKRVANIAVQCATKTFANYREELRKSNPKLR